MISRCTAACSLPRSLHHLRCLKTSLAPQLQGHGNRNTSAQVRFLGSGSGSGMAKMSGNGKGKGRGGKIEAYLDVVSPYSFYALKHLLEHRAVLETYGIEIEFIPVFLGGINQGSGNKPPWTLPAKAVYTRYDQQRANDWFGLPELRTKKWFPILSLLPQRVLTYLHGLSTTAEDKAEDKAKAKQTYESTFLSFYAALWLPPQTDISIPENLVNVLSSIPSSSSFPSSTSTPINPLANTSSPGTSTSTSTSTSSSSPPAPLFSEEQVKELLSSASTPEIKSQLTANTQRALDQGAFGCPWFWVRRDADGKEEPFFGSDRFGFMWRFLGVDVRGLEILPAASEGGKGSKL